MKELIDSFSNQLEKAIEIGKSAKLSNSAHVINNVLISGLGGSGIGGSLVSELVFNECKVPVSVTKGYFIPHYVNENTLFIASSYSGNTEETVNALFLAIEKKAKVVCITSGGKIQEIAKQHKLDCVVIPGDMPPRSCLGYSLTQLFFILHFNGLISDRFKNDLQKAIQLIQTKKNEIIANAKIIAIKLYNKTPVIYTTTHWEGMAVRFRQQINENSKVLCWHHVIPEMNHNELVGWKDKNDNLAVIIFRDRQEYLRNDARIEINKEIIKTKASEIIEIYSEGSSVIEKAIYFIHLGDWISYFLGEKRGVDITEVSVINHLKTELSKVK